MSIVNPGCDRQHIIDKARKAKTLGTLVEEENTYQAYKGLLPIKNVPQERRLILYTKNDLEEFKETIKDKSNDEILEMLGMHVTYNENGEKTLSRYGWPKNASYSFMEAGIDEKKLLEGVVEIKGNCNLTGSTLETLGSVRKIGGNLTLPLFTNAKDLSGIKSIGQDIICEVEHQKDAAEVIKKTKLNPRYFGGYINPKSTYSDCYYGFGAYDVDISEKLEALKKSRVY